jgi:hypothetical protein
LSPADEPNNSIWTSPLTEWKEQHLKMSKRDWEYNELKILLMGVLHGIVDKKKWEKNVKENVDTFP